MNSRSKMKTKKAEKPSYEEPKRPQVPNSTCAKGKPQDQGKFKNKKGK